MLIFPIGKFRKNSGGTSSFLGGIWPRGDPGQGSALLHILLGPPRAQKSALVSMAVTHKPGFTPCLACPLACEASCSNSAFVSNVNILISIYLLYLKMIFRTRPRAQLLGTP